MEPSDHYFITEHYLVCITQQLLLCHTLYFTLIYILFRSLLFCKMIVLNLRDVSFQHALTQRRCLLANLILGSSHCHCCLRVGGRAATMRRQITTSHASPNSSPCSWQLLISLSPKWIWRSLKHKHLQEQLTTASRILFDKQQTPKISDEPHHCQLEFYDQNENSVSIKHWGINWWLHKCTCKVKKARKMFYKGAVNTSPKHIHLNSAYPTQSTVHLLLMKLHFFTHMINVGNKLN